ncbi:MAG: GHKL domain-containing protein [Clostridia bacterium]|nr:GHKL domain-containing protein [Clostridia bacterium]
MEILKDISIFWSLLHALILFILLYETRYDQKQSLILTLCFMLPLVVFNGVMFLLVEVGKATALMSLTCTLPSLVFFFIIAKRRDGRFFFTFCLADTISYEIIMATSLLEHWFGGGYYVLLFISRLLIFPILEIIIYKKLRKPFLEVRNGVPGGWTLIAITSAVFYVLFYVISAYPTNFLERPDDFLAIILILILMPLTYIDIFRVLFSQKRMYEAEERRLNSEKQSKLLANELSIELEYVENAKIIRHDMRHNIGVVIECLDKGDIEKAKKYMRVYADSFEASPLVAYCGNETLNAVFRINARRCQQDGVEYEVQASVPPTLPYGEVEIGTLFGNLVENACEAAKKCESPFVHVHMETKHGKLLLEIKNSVSSAVRFENGLPVTTKAGGGIGTKSAMRIVEKYGGLLSMKQEGGVFITRLIQPL